MIDIPHITTSNPMLTAFIHLTIPREEIRHVMGPGLHELKATLEAQHITPAGPWFTHHLKMAPDTFDFRISIPVWKPVKPCGRVQPGELPAKKIARTIYHGGYEGLGDGWGEFMDWIEKNNLVPADELWECYLIGHDASPDSTTYRTELNRPLL